MREAALLDELYIFLDKKILTRSSMCIEDNKKKLLVFHEYLVRNYFLKITLKNARHSGLIP